MEATAVVLLSLLAVVVSGLLARVSRLPVPLVQMALGAATAATAAATGLAAVKLEPELFFLLFLTPLLFLDGWRIPKDALRREAPTILKLALGLVLFTVLGMGLFIHWLVPAMPLAVSFALAAAISPTDPIAVSAIVARTPIPARLMHVLQGEALLNDASGLVCMRYAVAATLTGVFSWADALASFAWLALGGLALGSGGTWVVARAATWASQRWGEDGGAQILITLLLPFGVYLLAEQLHCSGILAAVAAGVTMSYTDRWPWRAGTRLHRTAVWDMVQFAANGSIFVLLGEQLPALVTAAPLTALDTAHANAWWLAWDALWIALALAALRFVWVWVSLKVHFIGARWRGEVTATANWRMVLVTSLAGVRGAVTMAAVLTLPLTTASGAPFPARDVAILLAAGVIVLSMLLATTALPPALRALQAPAEPVNRAAEDGARRSAAKAAIAAIQAARTASKHAGAPAAAEHIVGLYQRRISSLAAGTPRAPRVAGEDIERRLRLVGLRAERAELVRYGREHGVSDLALRQLMREIDLQETRHGG
jgi:CPA1 family monovalent cation:H+ antiporter